MELIQLQGFFFNLGLSFLLWGSFFFFREKWRWFVFLIPSLNQAFFAWQFMWAFLLTFYWYMESTSSLGNDGTLRFSRYLDICCWGRRTNMVLDSIRSTSFLKTFLNVLLWWLIIVRNIARKGVISPAMHKFWLAKLRQLALQWGLRARRMDVQGTLLGKAVGCQEAAFPPLAVATGQAPSDWCAVLVRILCTNCSNSILGNAGELEFLRKQPLCCGALLECALHLAHSRIIANYYDVIKKFTWSRSCWAVNGRSKVLDNNCCLLGTHW